MDERLWPQHLFDRMARGAPHAGAFAVAVAVLSLVVARLPAPVVDRMIESDFRAAAQVWQLRILSQLDAGSRTFTTGALSDADRGFLGVITHASDVHRLTLADGEDRVFWSSRPELVGQRHEPEAVPRDGGQGYELVVRTSAEIDDFQLHVAPGDRRERRFVAEIVEPVTLDGQKVGTIEFYRDITVAREASVARVRLMLGIIAALALAMLAGVSLILLRAGRGQVRAAHARSEAQSRHLAEQERLAREVRLLGELNEWLQSCRSLPELFSMVARFMQHILPGVSGSLYVYSNSRDVLEGAASWNGATHDDSIRPEDCWGLRRGRTYAFGQSEVDFACAHIHFDVPRRYVCIPILAHGETVGLMTLTRKAATSQAAFDFQRRIAQTCAEQVSLAIANVRMRDELHHQAIRDPLTGLYNRRHMLDALRRLVDQHHPAGLAIASIDVDHFKRFNDNHGHDAGDVVLRSVSEVLERHADAEGIACRTGGEELMVIWPGIGPDEAAARAERLRADVAGLAVRYGNKILPRVTVSIGVARHPENGSMPHEVIRAADDALYAAKSGGRNQVTVAGQAEMDEGRTGSDEGPAEHLGWGRGPGGAGPSAESEGGPGGEPDPHPRPGAAEPPDVVTMSTGDPEEAGSERFEAALAETFDPDRKAG